MSMFVQHNMSAMNANRMLGITTSAQSKSTEKLSSGYRINRAADDAAGLAISEKMRGQIRGLNKASSNAQDGISMIQTAEGALTETHSIIQRMRELAVQATNDTNTDDDRTQIQNEIDQLTQEVDRIANTTEFNTKKLLDGSRQGAVAEKAGKANVDSTFSNSMVSAEITTNGSDKAAFTDVIRIEITKDFTEGQSTKGTPKLSDEEINNIYKLFDGSTTAATTVGTVGQAGTNVQLAPGASNTATNSTKENIKNAISVTKTALTAANSAASTSSAAVTTNADDMDSVIKSIFTTAETLKGQDGKTTLLKDGVTEADLKASIEKYVNALAENGKAAGAGESVQVTDALNELKSLFNTGTSVKTSGKMTADLKLNFKTSAGAAGTAGSLTAVDGSGTAVALSTVATDMITALDTYAKGVAGTQIDDAINKEKVAVYEDVLNTLENTELCESIANFKKEEAVNTSTFTDAKKAEQKAAVDAAKAKLDKLNTAESVLTVTDLFGNSDSAKNFEIASKVDDKNNLTISLKNKEGSDTIITVSNANNLKAGDVITITSEAMVESKQAATGKDAFRLQVGANAGQEVALGINSMKAADLNIVQTKEGVEGKALDVTNQATASQAVNAYDLALQKVSTERSKMGAMQNRLEHTIANLDTASENTQNAESRIRDTDMATEMVSFSKNNILAQAGQSMLAQANQSTQGVLSLLG